MAPPVPEPIRALIQYEFELGYNNDAILAGPYHVSSRTLQRMRRTWLDSGTVFIAKENPWGEAPAHRRLPRAATATIP